MKRKYKNLYPEETFSPKDEPRFSYRNKLNIQIGSKIKRLRIKKGLTQEQLGELIDTKKPNVSKLENGKVNPSIEFLEKVAYALDKELGVEFK